MDVVIPELGDFSDVEIIEILVSVGDVVEANAPLVTLETDKAAMDVPAPQAGKILEIAVKVGDRVSAGDAIAVMEPVVDTLEIPAAPEFKAKGGSSEGESSKDDATIIAAGATQILRHAEGAHSVRVPDLGEFSDVEVIDLLVASGDTVTAEQGLITIETDKAAMDVPSDVAGIVADLKVAVGDRVSAGDEIAVVLVDEQSEVEQAANERERIVEAPSASAENADATLKAPIPSAGALSPEPTDSNDVVSAGDRTIDEIAFGKAHASPSVRKLARELGVDLGRVRGSGRKERVRAVDVKSYVKQIMLAGAAAPPGPALPKLPTVDHSQFGQIETRPLTRIQKISGPRLHASWVNIPHVTQNDLADITTLESKRQQMKADALAAGIRLTPLAFIVRACVVALQEFPEFKSSLSDDGDSLILKHYTNIGFATDTPNGLVVPVIHDAERKGVMEIAEDLADLSAAARDRKLTAKQMQGGVFTISSLGGIGGTYFTPIINAPQVAILGVSRHQWQPVHTDGIFVPRLMLPLSLSYDHRVIDGAQAVRFTTRLGELLGDVDGLLGGGQ